MPILSSVQASEPKPLQAVLFDVDFTLVKPGPELGPESYVRVGRRYGLELDASRYEAARTAAVQDLKRHPELAHDDEIWIRFTEDIVRGMGGNSQRAHECALELERAWEHAEHFELYEDALPVMEELRRYGLKLALVSNGARDIDEFVAHHGLDVDAAVGSRAHGKVKPDPTIFRAALERLGVEPAETAMVGDSLEDDVAGARGVGIRAFLLDREGRYPEVEDRLPSLLALPAALGLQRPR